MTIDIINSFMLLFSLWQRSSGVEQGTHKPSVGGSNPPAVTSFKTMETKQTSMPVIAGILMLISAGLKLLSLFALLGASFFMIMPQNFPRLGPAIVLAYVVLLVVIIVLSVIGGICSLQRKRWGLALTGAIFSILPFSILGIAEIVLIVLSKDEFKAG